MMRINVVMLVPDDGVNPDSDTELTEQAYEELIEALTDLGYSDVSVSRGF
jgi:Holliday junction resolvasome RuvABC DNA-binding subunit